MWELSPNDSDQNTWTRTRATPTTESEVCYRNKTRSRCIKLRIKPKIKSQREQQEACKEPQGWLTGIAILTAKAKQVLESLGFHEVNAVTQQELNIVSTETRNYFFQNY